MAVPNARQITRRARSNLAFALASLPAARRRDMETFYAFCRVVDDLADDESVPVAQRQAGLARWHGSIDGPLPGEDPLAGEVRDLMARYPIPAERCHEIIRGMEMDLQPQRFATAVDLEAYCHLVASVVGLVSIEIFGYRDPACREYARLLGLALQWTNILRDVAEDAARGRLYLPTEDLDRCGVAEQDLLAGRVGDGFVRLMEHEWARAVGRYRQAEAALPAADRRTMMAAETMRRIYQRLGEKMRRDGFRVFAKRYRLGKLHLLGLLVATRLGW